jgi:hypothetical protein
MENIQRVSSQARTKIRSPKNMLELEVWKKIEGEDLWLGPKGVIVNSAALEERKFFYNVVQVS